jgi:hypothetical protein
VHGACVWALDQHTILCEELEHAEGVLEPQTGQLQQQILFPQFWETESPR